MKRFICFAVVMAMLLGCLFSWTPGVLAAIPNPTGTLGGIEIIINNESGSSGSQNMADELIAEIKASLSARGWGPRKIDQVLGKLAIEMPPSKLNAADLSNWVVYDHYDNGYWGVTGGAPASLRYNPPQAWINEFEYKGEASVTDTGNPLHPSKWTGKGLDKNGKPIGAIDSLRPYFPMNLSSSYQTKTKLSDWLLSASSTLYYFDRHLYSQTDTSATVDPDNPRAKMDFVGYYTNSPIDFAFYATESKNDKLVTFDVDASKVYSHSLAAPGFLLNTGIDYSKNEMYGYYLVWRYPNSSAAPTNLELYKLASGLSPSWFHGKTDGNAWGSPVDGNPFDISSGNFSSSAALKTVALSTNSNWWTTMNVAVEIVFGEDPYYDSFSSVSGLYSATNNNKNTGTTYRLYVWQKSKTSAGIDRSGTTPILVYDMDDTGYYGFGPAVTYAGLINGHTCDSSSSFIYSNLGMEIDGTKTVSGIQKLEEFKQANSEKYFIDLYDLTNPDANSRRVETNPDFIDATDFMLKNNVCYISNQRNAFLNDGDPDPAELSLPADYEPPLGDDGKTILGSGLISEIAAYLVGKLGDCDGGINRAVDDLYVDGKVQDDNGNWNSIYADLQTDPDQKYPLLYINLTEEKLINNTSLQFKSYSVNGGEKWKAIKKDELGDAKFAKMLAKGVKLRLSDKAIDKETKKPEEGATIVSFADILKCTEKFPAVAVNYAIYPCDMFNETPGEWALTLKSNMKKASFTADDAYKGQEDGQSLLLIGVVVGKGKTITGSWGEFCPDDGITVKPLPNSNKPEKSVYMVKIAPKENTDSSGTVVSYTAGGKAKKITATSQQKPPKTPKIKPDKDTGEQILKVKSGMVVGVQYDDDTEEETLFSKSTYKSGYNLTKEADDSEAVYVWMAATAKKPASVSVEITVPEPVDVDDDDDD